MAREAKDTVDLYDDRGNCVAEEVPIEVLSPMRNEAIQSIVNDIKRTVAVDLEGIENALQNATVGGKGMKIPGREMDVDIVDNAEAIADEIEKMIRVYQDDDTNVEPMYDGKRLLVQLPSERVKVMADPYSGTLQAGMAVVHAIIDVCEVDMWDANMVKAAVFGRYPQTIDYFGGNVASMLDVPMKQEGVGYALRNIMVNHIVAATRKNTMQAVCLAATLQQTAMFEMGDALGPFERLHLLGYAYQGLNADNMVYDIVKKHGKEGTVGTVVREVVERALEDGVIEVKEELPSFKVYKANDMDLWNAYAAAGLVAAVMVNQGAARAAQGVSATILYYNDLLEYETGLPGVDFGRAEGTAVGFSFFSHSIYGGGGPGIFHGNHIVTRHSKGFAIPPVAAAMALDAGTQMFSPEVTSKLIGDVFGEIDEFREPMKYITEAAAEEAKR
uniref:METHYL-COENZYME M REDUCTASE I BETA SUBUNIT n=1 Tax=Methanopyrus kandleri TaxID=2320 RepID=UPI00001111F8|nr:Chain B, METHYL-COENZYME M REDUCTASE I BETA SUBUNIT [Methanopyrus kandleri]1E6V_E Chain E, METHYL-COENZYME M REDUCTASE I BETA SUBUNIT [Methanopyrus kandleri]